ncbi:unnamed protein product [Thlaspi arvense]|uniref:Uncharacterized protein n=1 Tax=Thlaspi arvense TaxID=13288 RepID=A0AAU9RBH8_THLAR|nr:unnamed protein product [Thlaspi arvense]
MANENSRNVQALAIGTMVSFKMRTTGDQYQGMVFYFTPQPNGFLFGLQNVDVWRMDGRYEHISGFSHFNLNDITEFEVDVVARRPNYAQGGRNNNRDGGSSSKAIENKMGSLRLDPPSK